MISEIEFPQNGILSKLGLESRSTTPGMRRFFKRLSQKFMAEIPEGYQDEHGFHFGTPLNPKGEDYSI
jgi:hypothetical protein